MRKVLFATTLLVGACTSAQISAGATDATLIVNGLAPAVAVAETAVPAKAAAIGLAYTAIQSAASAIAASATPSATVVSDLEAAVTTIANDIPPGAIPAADQLYVDAAVALLPAIVAEVQVIQSTTAGGTKAGAVKMATPKMTPTQARAVLAAK